MAAQGGTRDGAAEPAITSSSYLDIDAIELIEAHPRASLRQPPEELPHHLVVDLIRAVEHHAQDADSLRLKMDAVLTGREKTTRTRSGEGWRGTGNGTGGAGQ